MRLSVVHLAANRWWTGSADPTVRLILGLEARGHRLQLGLVPGDRFEAKAREAGVRLVPGVSLEPRTIVADVLALRRLVRAAAVDVLHAHHSHDHWIAWMAAGGARRGRIPVVRTFHHRRTVRTDPLARWLYARTAAAFAASRSIEARCRVAGFPAARITPLPGIADLRRFPAGDDGRAIRQEFDLGAAPVIACVSRLAPGRGHERLLAGFQRLLADLPDARLLVVGKGESRARLEQRVVDLGLAGRVCFTGYRDGDLPSVLAAADCFALMAGGSDESCRAALEAMAAGRPVVAGRAGALPETVVHGETGFLVDDDAASVAAGLRAVLGDPERAVAMGRAARRRAEEAFGPEAAVAVVERVYRSLA